MEHATLLLEVANADAKSATVSQHKQNIKQLEYVVLNQVTLVTYLKSAICMANTQTKF